MSANNTAAVTGERTAARGISAEHFIGLLSLLIDTAILVVLLVQR
jgi:hypothetical protein